MTTTRRGADLLVEALQSAKVRYLFTLSGNQIMPIFDASIGSGLELIHVRHEAAAVHMADAWGRLTGQPGVAMVTAGPGFANTLSALYVATMAESPLVLLSGRSPAAGIGCGAFQDMPQAEMAGHVAKASWRATDANRLGHDLARAFRIASTGRPGPVHVTIPFDLLEEPVAAISGEALPREEDFQPAMSLLNRGTAERIIEAVREADRPLILTGPALTRGDGPEAMDALAEALAVPVVGMGSPRGVNDPSLGAYAEVLARADLIVLVAKKLDFTLQSAAPPTIAADCRLMQVDPESSVLEQSAKVVSDPARLVVTEIADGLATLQRLLQLTDGPAESAAGWRNEVEQAIRYRPPEWAELDSPSDGPLHPARLCRAVAEFVDAADESVFVSDGGEFGQWAQAIIRGTKRIINGPSGAIGSCLPFALAARLAFPNARIVATLGDGTFGFHATEFDTAVRYALPFVAVVGNDACWNAEYQIQLRQYGPERLIGCELAPTRYDLMVQAMGGHAENVAGADPLQPALQRAVDSGLPACVNVRLQRVAAPIIRFSD